MALTKKTFFLSSIVFISLGAVCFWYFFNLEPSFNYEFITLEPVSLKQVVSVTGRVVPTESVDLALERSGRVKNIAVKVGDKVEPGQVLLELENNDLLAELRQVKASIDSARAQYQQAQAALDSERAKLNEMRQGTRPEEVAIARATVENKNKVLADAKINLQNVKASSDQGLVNAYAEVADILNDVYIKAGDAINKQINELFIDEWSDDPQLTFSVNDSQIKLDVEGGRAEMNSILTHLSTVVFADNSDVADKDHALIASKIDLILIRDFLSGLLNAVNFEIDLTNTTATTYKGYIDTARKNINTAITNITDQENEIAALKINNQKNISTAEASVNDASNALSLAQAELKLKEAGATTEQIASQSALVKKAEANVSTSLAGIKEAEARVLNAEAQIAKTILLAPIKSVVANIDVKPGEIIVGGSSVILLISENAFEVETYIPEADIAKVKIGDTVSLTLDAYSDTDFFKAFVSRIDPAETIIEGVATYKVSLSFAEVDDRVKSGMTADLDILTAELKDVVAVPLRAVNEIDNEYFVKVVDVQGVIQEIKVLTGLRGSEGYVEIISGLKIGDRVITVLEEE